MKDGATTPSFLFGGKMIFWTQIGLAFFAGYIVAKLWTLFLDVGYTALMYKLTHINCLRVMKDTVDMVEVLLEMKYSILESVEIEDNKLQFHKRVDQQAIADLKKRMISSLKQSVPRSHSGLIHYENWNEAVDYLNKESQ